MLEGRSVTQAWRSGVGGRVKGRSIRTAGDAEAEGARLEGLGRRVNEIEKGKLLKENETVKKELKRGSKGYSETRGNRLRSTREVNLYY